jgi:hypothetical protein
MREHAHDEEAADVRTKPGGRPEVAPGGEAGRLLHLQRSAGNAAVTQAIQDGALGGSPSSGTGVSLQPEDEEGEEETEE